MQIDSINLKGGSSEYAGRWLERIGNYTPRRMIANLFIGLQDPAYRPVPHFLIVDSDKKLKCYEL